MFYYFIVALGIIAVCGLSGLALRKGTPRID
jgi:hypothetical protein